MGLFGAYRFVISPMSIAYMKIYVNMAQKYHRTSIVPKFSSTHFKGTVLSICDYIQLPSTMRCQTNTDIIRERDCGSVESNGYLDAPLVCYKGPLPLMGKRSSRHAVVAAVEMAPHFELVDRIKRLSLSFLESMGIFPETHLTVVHWRRGDQLSTRCPQRKDKSVNCGTVAQLIEAVTNLNLSTTVYVATNEILSQSSLEQLAAMGFLSFRDGNYTAQSAVDAFMIEVYMMIYATNFYGWGLSEVNDIVEFERFRRGRAFCQSGDVNASSITWCSTLTAGSDVEQSTKQTKTSSIISVPSDPAAPPPVLGTGGSFNTQGRVLLWINDGDGLFSQFLQLKLKMRAAREFHRILLIPPFRSKHFDNIPVSLCDVLQLPRSVRCVDAAAAKNIHRRSRCEPALARSDVSSVATVCYNGDLPLWGAPDRKHAIMSVVGIGMPFKLSPTFIPLIGHSFLALEIVALEQLRQRDFISSSFVQWRALRNYTVVHWRRQDQLYTRCSKKDKEQRDWSVNCATASALAQLIRSQTSDDLIYIATDEPMGSKEVTVLRELGFKTFQDLHLLVRRRAAGALSDNYRGTEEFMYEGFEHHSHGTENEQYNIDTADKGASELAFSQDEDKMPNLSYYVAEERRRMLDPHPQQATASLQSPVNSSRSHSSTGALHITPVEAFAVEVALMLHATTFLGFGLSEVNDVVEVERRRAGKSWCATMETVDGAQRSGGSDVSAARGDEIAGDKAHAAHAAGSPPQKLYNRFCSSLKYQNEMSNYDPGDDAFLSALYAPPPFPDLDNLSLAVSWSTDRSDSVYPATTQVAALPKGWKRVKADPESGTSYALVVDTNNSHRTALTLAAVAAVAIALLVMWLQGWRRRRIGGDTMGTRGSDNRKYKKKLFKSTNTSPVLI